jgi:hypothetical protein
MFGMGVLIHSPKEKARKAQTLRVGVFAKYS